MSDDKNKKEEIKKDQGEEVKEPEKKKGKFQKFLQAKTLGEALGIDVEESNRKMNDKFVEVFKTDSNELMENYERMVAQQEAKKIKLTSQDVMRELHEYLVSFGYPAAFYIVYDALTLTSHRAYVVSCKDYFFKFDRSDHDRPTYSVIHKTAGLMFYDNRIDAVRDYVSQLVQNEFA